MPIDTQHAEYKKQVRKWIKCRDVIEGEDAIRDKIQEYLPMPPGMQSGVEVVDINDALDSQAINNSGAARYAFYATFAEFPELVAPAVNGMQGLVHTKPPEFILPDSLKYLEESATVDGETLESMWEFMTREILTTGRVVVMAEVVEKDNQLRFCLYTAESLINWRVAKRIEGGKANLIVFEEDATVQNEDDEYELENVTRWRELFIDESGKYAVRIWEESKDGKPAVVETESGEDRVYPSIRGKAFDLIPVVVVNATDNGFEYGSIPMLPAVRRVLSIFKKSADYNRSLYFKGDPQPVLFGVQPNEVPESIGGGRIWAFSRPEGKAMFLDIDGNGIPLMREAIQDQYERFSYETGKLLESSEKGPESGEALRRRQSTQLVTIRSLVVNAAEGLQEAIRMIGRLMGLAESVVNGIFVNPNLEFTESQMSVDDLVKIDTTARAGSRLSNESLHELLRRGGLTTNTFDEEEELLDGQGPAFGVLTDSTNHEGDTNGDANSIDDSAASRSSEGKQ